MLSGHVTLEYWLNSPHRLSADNVVRMSVKGFINMASSWRALLESHWSLSPVLLRPILREPKNRQQKLSWNQSFIMRIFHRNHFTTRSITKSQPVDLVAWVNFTEIRRCTTTNKPQRGPCNNNNNGQQGHSCWTKLRTITLKTTGKSRALHTERHLEWYYLQINT